MKRITKVLVSILMLTLSVSSASAETNSINNVSSSEFDWNPVMEAIIQSDRYSISKSKEMFLLMQSVYNPLNSIEQAIRAWNGGNHFSVKKTQRYFEKVMNLLKK